LCFGTGKAPLIGRPAKGKINGFELMAINLRNQSNSKIDLNSRQMKDRFNSYKDKYKKTHTLSLSTGFGLTEEDRLAGITTIDDKLDKMCPHFHAMHQLMGKKPFVNPLYKVDAQNDVESSQSSGSEDEEVINKKKKNNSLDISDSSRSDRSSPVRTLITFLHLFFLSD
jgi:hypothetical protein